MCWKAAKALARAHDDAGARESEGGTRRTKRRRRGSYGAPACLAVALLACPPLLSTLSGQAIAPGEVLTLSHAVETALKTQPSVMAGAYMVKVNEARIGEARSAYYPQANASMVYTRVSAPSSAALAAIAAAAPGTNPLPLSGGAASGIPGVYDLYTPSVSFSQMIYDFGRTSGQVKINSLTAQSSRDDLATTQNTVAFNVKQAYYNALQAERDLDTAKQAVEQLQEHLDQARSFLEIGTKTKFDVTQAEVNLSNARLTLIQAENQVSLTRLSLSSAMGIAETPSFRLEDSLAYAKFNLSLEEALSTAYERRPDLQSLIKKREAANQSVALARAGYLPQLNANANYYYTGADFPLQSGWSAGLTLSVPIFNGFLTRRRLQEAEGAYGAADANERTARLNIFTQVRQDYLALRAAEESIAASAVAVRQANENVELASGRYREGVGIALDVIDAVAARGNAEFAYTRALVNCKNVQAAIQNDIGLR